MQRLGKCSCLKSLRNGANYATVPPSKKRSRNAATADHQLPFPRTAGITVVMCLDHAWYTIILDPIPAR